MVSLPYVTGALPQGMKQILSWTLHWGWEYVLSYQNQYQRDSDQ